MEAAPLGTAALDDAVLCAADDGAAGSFGCVAAAFGAAAAFGVASDTSTAAFGTSTALDTAALEAAPLGTAALDDVALRAADDGAAGFFGCVAAAFGFVCTCASSVAFASASSVNTFSSAVITSTPPFVFVPAVSIVPTPTV